MAKILNGLKLCVISPRTWSTKKWTKDQIEKWVKQAGGTLQKEFDPQNTTHLVIEEQVWKNKTMAVQLAFEARANGRKVYIVTPEWLGDCLTVQRKFREKDYSWEKIDQDAAGDQRKKGGKQSGEGEGGEDAEDGVSGLRSHQAMLGEVLQEGTEDYVGDHDRRVFEAENAERQKIEKELMEIEARRKEQEKQAAKEKRKEHSDLMKKSVKRGRGEVFNANQHVFKDTTGFEYNCTLTKVDTLTNRKERLVLTLYESNNGVPETDHPPTYATNLHFAGTGKQPKNNILAAIGSNRLTAIRMWRKAFEEQTGVSWDDRIKAHNERVRDRARDGDTPGIFSTRRGENGDIKSKTRAAEDAVPFEKRKFEYMPPLHAARGWLPHGKEEVPEVLRQMRGKPNEQRERTEQWTMMSGGNGYDPNASSSSSRQSIENARAVQIDLTEDDPVDELDGLVTPGSGNDGDTNRADISAANVTAKGVNGGPSSEMDTQALVDSLLAGTHDRYPQDNIFDAGDLAGQQQQQFTFDQDNIGLDFGVQQPGMGSIAGNAGVSGDDQGNMNAAPATADAAFQPTMPAHDPFDFPASFAGQTQLAAQVGQDLLGLGCMDSAGASALVVVSEAEQLEAAASVEKRKRGEGETDEDMEPAAKRFFGGESEDGEAAA
ncbi:hypothetical protein Q7P35_006043 [Cladosporium inversicolor]